MPVKSAKQFRLMEAAKGGNLHSAGGPSSSVAKEFLSKTSEDKKKKFASAFKKKKMPMKNSGMMKLMHEAS